MQRLTKGLCFLLALLTLVLTLAACNDGGKAGITTTTTTTPSPSNGDGVPEVSYDENGYLNDHIDRNAIDFGDRKVYVLAWQQNKELLFPEAMVDSESLSNTVYERNHEIEEQLGIEIHPTFKSSHMNSDSSDGEDLYNEAKKGTIKYDAIVCYSHFPAKMALDGILTDLTSLEFPETDMPWYPDGLEAWTISNRLFFIANNSCVQNILASWCIYANKDMIEEKGLEDIEQVVVDGDWTLDTLKTYSRHWAAEAEGNANKAEEDRVYGFSLDHRTAFSGFYIGAGFRTYEKDETDFPVPVFNQSTYVEQVSAFVDKFLDITNSPEFKMGSYYGGFYEPLENKNVVFYGSSLNEYTRLDDYTYCIIPMPKLNDQQENYYTLTRDITELWCVPKNSEDPEIGGLLIEAISSSDYRLMAPKFFDKDFKYRYSSDENGVKIFELLRSSFVIDFGAVWCAQTGLASPYGSLWDCLDDNPNDDPLNTLTNNYATKVANAVSNNDLALHNLKKKIKNL